MNWKLLAKDIMITLTGPLWFIPAVCVLIVSSVILAFHNRYVRTRRGV